MKIENLPKLVKLTKAQTCYVCKKTIKKGQSAVFHWWVQPKAKAYDHVGCAAKVQN